MGTFRRQAEPRRIQRYECRACGRRFSDQTFRLTYWLRKPELLTPVFHRLVGCGCYRQIAREFEVSPSTIARLAGRLGRHCLLYHDAARPKGPLREPLTVDSFESFEYSQYHPTSFHLAVGKESHFVYGVTASECRRSGGMSPRQKRRREEIESRQGRPDPNAVELDVAELLEIVASRTKRLRIHTDRHKAYPRAIRRLAQVHVEHRTISSRAARTPQNPLFAVNLLDLLIRHSGANHKRETIAWSKRRASALLRMFVLVVWRNWIKSISERRRDASPAMRLQLSDRRLRAPDVLGRRLFPTRSKLPDCWRDYYREAVPTRSIPNGRVFTRRYAG